MTEKPPARCERRAYITGFTGSAGSAVITQKEALLWTDGRYFIQAAQQMEEGVWTLIKAGLPEVPTVEKWLVENLPKNSVLGFDPWTISIEGFKKLRDSVTARKRSALVLKPTDNLVDLLWQQDTEHPMPPLPSDQVFIHPLEYAGKSVAEKLTSLAADMKKERVTHILVTALDDVAWLLNLRGSDTDCSPIFISYCIAKADATATLFIDPAKVTDDVRAHLSTANVALQPYEAIVDALADTTQVDAEYSYDAAQCNVRLFDLLEGNPVVESSPRTSLVTVAKAAKNDVELQGMKDSHVRDAAALVKYLKWLEDSISQKVPVTECSGAEKLRQFRSEVRLFRGLSFETISGVGSNAAIIHYIPSAETDRPITDDAIYLLDSGGQYLDGTTDVTRTMHFGQPTPKQIECFTRVLKGHLALRRLVVPNTCTGPAIDSWARASLWQVGLDYLHGTGHGVGCYLNVHEGPHGIGQRSSTSKLLAGYVVSNEPGYYEQGEFGIRIENLCYFRETSTPYNMPGVKFLELDDLTMVPIQAKLIDVGLLNDEELTALNEYHRRVLDQVGPLLSDTPEVHRWLEDACKPLYRFVSC
eukprot:GGOE01003213.1.p1 GENE.GGOE01003213.1~~GGOE01003213.1.p1  ORF type:complete len:629 (-),score=213.97 GGOE01003213.1:203-1963(-)